MARTVQRLRLLAGTALASSLAMPVVYAAGDVSDKMSIMDLPMYDPLPAKERFDFVPKEPNSLERGIGSVRIFLTEYKLALDSAVDKVVHKWEVSKAHTMGLIDYIQNDPNILPRLGVITVAGLGGVVAGYKRGVGRKVTYSAIGVTSASCLCYPNEVTGAVKYSAGAVANQGKNLWHTITAPSAVEPELPKVEEKVPEPVAVPEVPAAPAAAPEAAPAAAPEAPPAPPAPEAPPAPPAPEPAAPLAQVAIEPPPPQAVLEAVPEPPKDFGQSSKEDNDLYTTRG